MCPALFVCKDAFLGHLILQLHVLYCSHFQGQKIIKEDSNYMKSREIEEL